MIKGYIWKNYNENDEKEMKALTGFEPVHNGKRMDCLLAATLPTELSKLTTNNFQNHTWLLNMQPKYFDFNVFLQSIKWKHAH